MTARRVPFLTGHDVSGHLPSGTDLDAQADPHAATAAHMGRRTFPALAGAPVARGLPRQTPALPAEATSPKPALILDGPLAEGAADA